MLKNDKGVTLAMLIVTIIVIIILSITTISASEMLLKNTKIRNTTTNMILVKGKVEALYEEYSFNDTLEKDYVGTKVNDVSMYGVDNAGKWYKWDKENLTYLGFDEGMLIDGAEYIVNYETGEVIYTLGVKDETGKIKYTLKELLD